MRLTKLSAEAASALAVKTLGLDPESIDLTSIEGIAASLRRAASFMCPTGPGRLVDAVLDAFRPVSTDDLARVDVVAVLEKLVSSGDLIELRQDGGGSTRLLYLAPPSYIESAPGSYLLTGIRPYGVPIVEGELAEAIEHEGNTRLLSLAPSDGPVQLLQLGLRAVKKDRWVSSPAVESPGHLIDRHKVRLDVAGEAGWLDGLVLLDPASAVCHYRGRWRSPAPTDAGDFVARRPQAYGADLWCLIRFDSGVAQRLIELPVDDPVLPGRDEAWRYQAAVDAQRGVPQRFRVRRGATVDADVTFDFLSPLPGFAERYVQLIGLALGRTTGALFSYRVPSGASADVAAFLTDMLWMAQEEERHGV